MEIKYAIDAIRNLGVSLNDYDSDALEILVHFAEDASAELAQLRAEKAAALEQKPVCGCIVTDFGQWPQFYREADMTLWELPVGNHNLYAAPAPAPATVPENNLPSILLKTSPFITCVSGDGKPKVVLQFSSLTDAQDVFCAIHNSTILQSAQEPKL